MANYETTGNADDIFEEPVKDEEDEKAAAVDDGSTDDKDDKKDGAGNDDATSSKDDEKGGNPAENAPEGYVPHAALHQARLQAKQLQDALEEANRKLGAVDSLKEQIMEIRNTKQTQQEQSEDPKPDKDEDPLAYLEWQNRQMQKKLDAIEAAKNAEDEQAEQVTQSQAQLNQFMTNVREQVLEFEKTQPDYGKAFEFAVEKRMAEYEAMGVTDPQVKQQMFDREVMQVAATAMQNGLNPGASMYALAKSWGYTKADAGNGGDAADTGAGTLQEQMEALEKGGRAGGMGSGGSPASDADMPNIDAMTDAEFDAYWEKTFGNSAAI